MTPRGATLSQGLSLPINGTHLQQRLSLFQPAGAVPDLMACGSRGACHQKTFDYMDPDAAIVWEGRKQDLPRSNHLDCRLGSWDGRRTVGRERDENGTTVAGFDVLGNPTTSRLSVWTGGESHSSGLISEHTPLRLG